jgi:asparagine synthase (glutamine-hydrolysing)
MPGILGILSNIPQQEAKARLATMLRCMLHEPFYTHGTYLLPEHGCYLGWVNHKRSFSDCNPIISPTRDVVIIFSGEHFAHQDVPSTEEEQHHHRYRGTSAKQLLSLYETKGDEFLPELNGWFAGVIVDLRKGTILLFNDRFGLHRVYYSEDKDSFAFSSEAKSLLSIRPESRTLDLRSLGEFVGFGCTFQNRTLFSNVLTLPGGSAWTFSGPSHVKRRHYFSADIWEQQPLLAEDAYYTSLKNTISRILPNYFLSNTAVGISLTGGLDTRLIMAGTRHRYERPVCYTYGGIYRDCFDVTVARALAKACDQPHHVIPLGDDFFINFSAHAERTVWLTDGCLDLCGAHEVYLSRRARELAPVRLTGNYGSEVLRSATTLKYTAPPDRLFDVALTASISEARALFAEMNLGHKVSFAVFKEIPWHLYGRLAAAESQLIVRSPYMDNELVALTYQAPPQLRATNKTMLRLIAELSPSLYQIETDMGYGGTDPRLAAYLRRVHRYLLFKAEWYYNAGMPHWLARLEHNALAQALEGLFLGSHKIEHYRLWFRNQLSEYVQSMLGDSSTAARAYLDRPAFGELITAHRTRARNCMNEMNRLLTLELIQRLLLERDYRKHDTATAIPNSSIPDMR